MPDWAITDNRGNEENQTEKTYPPKTAPDIEDAKNRESYEQDDANDTINQTYVFKHINASVYNYMHVDEKCL